MSRSAKDQSGGHPIRNKDTYSCGCCPILSPDEKSRTRSTRERALDANEHNANHGSEEDYGDAEAFDATDQHVYAGGRCVRCGIRLLDAEITDGLYRCAGKTNDAPISYSTSSGGEVVASHEF